MPDRQLGDWIESYIDYTQEQESPEKLHLWTAFAVLSAAARRQIWMRRGFSRLYTNIYVLIVAESARIRKSTAMDIGVDLLREAFPGKDELRVLTGKTTPEGMVKQLNRATVIFKDENKPHEPTVNVRSDCLIHADELATLFGYDKNSASRMAILLTEGYACKTEYRHTTSKEGSIVLKNMYPVLLAGTDPRNLKVLPEEAVGGLIGRLIFVTAQSKRKSIAWPEETENISELGKKLRSDLRVIGSLEGEIKPTLSAKKVFEEWYNALSNTTADDPRIDAFHERCHDTALKIAMLISISQSNQLIVTEQHIAVGIEIIEKQLPEFSRVMNWAGVTIYAQNRAKLIDLLKRHGGACTKAMVMKVLAVTLDDITTLEESLIAEGTMTAVKIGRDMIYKIKD